jgi:hypothetical protein
MTSFLKRGQYLKISVNFSFAICAPWDLLGAQIKTFLPGTKTHYKKRAKIVRKDFDQARQAVT